MSPSRPSCLPLPHTRAREGGSVPLDAQSAGVGRGQPVPGSVQGWGFRQVEPWSPLALCTVRPHWPLTRTLSPLSPHPALCSLSECHHLPLDMAVSVPVRLSTECQLHEDRPFPGQLRAVSPSLGQPRRVVDTLFCE